MYGETRFKLLHFRGIVTTLLLVAAVACGTAATATPAPTATKATTAAPTAVATTAPTATAAPMSTPAPVGSPGKVTFMTANWYNERFDPQDGANWGTVYMRLLHGYFIAGTEKTEMVPGIATDWKVSPDGRTWTFTIRKGVKFHNGDEVTMEDVFFSEQHLHGQEAITQAIDGTIIEQAKATEKIEITGPDAISWTHTRPLANFPFFQSELFGSQHGGAVLPKKVYDAVGKEGYEKVPVGAGSARLAEYKSAELMRFERFEDHYYQPAKGLPEDRRFKFQTLDLRLVPEEATRVAALQAGQADIIETSLSSGKKIEGAGGRLVFSRESSYHWVLMPQCWQARFWCNKKEVRQALDYAIDKELIRDRLYGKDILEVKGWLLVTPSALGYSPDLAPFPYDPEKAKQLLAQAGYPGGAGFPPFKIYTWVSGDFPFMPEVAQIIADMWKKNLGLQTEVVVGDPTGIREQLRNRELDGNILLRSGEAQWDRGNSFLSFYDKKSQNRIAEDPELQAAMEETLSVAEPEKRHEAYNQFIRKAWDAHYSWGTIYVNNPWGVSSRIATWQPWSLWAGVSAMWTITLK